MAESIVMSSVEWIGWLLIQESNVLLDVKDEVEKLKQKLEYLLEYLQDADAKSHSGEQVRVLTVHARKLAYDAEDLIDTYILGVFPNTHFTDRHWLVKSVHFLYKAPRAYILGKHIQELKNNVSELTDKLDNQQVRRISLVEEANDFREKETRESYPYEEGEYVIGWEKDIPKLVELLMGQGKNQDVHVVWIVGMGGCGKTTLARKLYNYPYVKESFNCWAWVFVSQKVNPHHLLLEILRQVTSTSYQHEISPRASKNELVDQLRSFLEKKSYLVVVDDVWNEMALKDILPALPDSKGSKIIITTRFKNIVQFEISQSLNVYEPPPLDEDQGWQLLSNFAFNHHTNSSSQLNVSKFQQLGKKMLRQCRGLPLAIVALAGILRDKTTIGEWQQVSDTILTQVMESKCRGMSDTVEQILSLSYDDLPSNLKSCFLYLAAYPEDCEIPAGMLTRMWIAEGLVTAHKMLSIEEVATKRLVELSHRFMVQVVKTNFKKEIKVVHLHDLLRDLCITKARQQSFLEVFSPNYPATNSTSPITTQPRRAALHSSTSLPMQVSHLRTIVLLTRSSILHLAYKSKEMVDLGTISCKFKLLRVLSLWGIKTSNGTLPKEIGRLIHLRYLGIRATNIVELPVSIESLRNLLTLDYRNVESDHRDVTIKIPNILWKLVLLRHLFLPMDHPWSVAELKLSSMKNLQSLWGLKQDVVEARWLSREMQTLSTTLKKLRVIVSTVDDMRAIFSCRSLKSDGRLHTFHCELRNDVALQDVIVNHLANHQRLNKLILIGNICMDLSLLLPVNLIKLELRDSELKHGDPMSALGALADLKVLKLSNFYMGSCFTCKLRSFPKLEKLYMENLRNLATWRIEQGALPCLKKLEIVACCKLRDFPHGLVFVTTLEQLEFSRVPKEFAQKAKEYGWSSKRLRLPDNFEAIIKQCDSPVDTSSISQLYEQLMVGVFLNNRKQKYWAMIQDDEYCNCFMVYASDLCISFSGKKNKWWKYEDSDRDETIMIAMERQPGISSMEARQSFNTTNLSLNVTYEIAWVISIECVSMECVNGCMLADEIDIVEAYPGIHTQLILPNGSILNHSHSPQEGLVWHKWIKVPVGILYTTPEIIGQDIELSLRLISVPSGLIKGFLIKPASSLYGSELVGPISSVLQEASAKICSLC